MYIEICVNLNKLQEAESKLKELKISVKTPLEPSFQWCLHFADVAYYLYNINPKYYVRAIELYERAASQLAGLNIEDHLKNKYNVIWSYRILHLLNRMLNHDNIKTYAKGKDWNKLTVFHRICTLVGQVLKSPYQHNIYQARSYVELVDAQQKLRGEFDSKLTPNFIRSAIGQLKINEKWCIGKAQQLGPDDGSVFEKTGRLLRTRATCLADFQEAERVLKHCVALCPGRHVAHHHLSHVYRSMWIVVNKFEEARLFNNPQKTGARKKKTKRKQRNDAYSHLAQYQHQPTNAAESVASQNLVSLAAGGDSDEGVHLEDDNDSVCHSMDTLSIAGSASHGAPVSSDAPSSATARPQSQNKPIDLSQSIKNRGVVIIKPKHAAANGKVQHFRTPDYFDVLRTSNPTKSCGTVHNEWLDKAVEHLEKANEAVSGTAVRYLVDLARLYISIAKHDKALQCFSDAKHELAHATPHDAAYVYEQWGLYRHYNEANDDELQDIKELYREAIASSIAAGEKSRMAFYELKSILDGQLKNIGETDQPKNRLLSLERALLDKLVQNFDRAKGRLRDIFESDRRNTETLINLISVLADSGQFIEAFEYLKFLLPLFGPEDLKRVCQENDLDPVKVTQQAVEYLGSDNYVSVGMFKTLFERLTNAYTGTSEAKRSTVLLMDDCSMSQHTRVLHTVLEESGLTVIDSITYPDKFLGGYVNQVYKEELLRENQRCVVIVVEAVEGDVNDDNGQLTSLVSRSPEMMLLDALSGQDWFRPILATCSESFSLQWKNLQRFTENSPVVKYSVESPPGKELKHQLRMQLLRALYDNIDEDESSQESDQSESDE